ncbi:hypothetical protein FO519_004416 [Halicephalobus sp. NKZ332]|nr:hypothetical protein FO519_004416 [Halicephalobus sp. NKZ332]
MTIDFLLIFSLIGGSFAIPAKPAARGLSCDDGWSWAPFRKQCIRVQDTKMTEADAEKDCQQYGGHLVSIENIFEENEILNITQIVGHCSYYWLGAKKSGNSNYSWTDQRPFGYSNFGPGVDSDPSFDCVDIHVTSTNWHTEGCEKKNCFICEKPDGTGNQTNSGTDCAALKAAGNTKKVLSGVYNLTLNGQTFQAYCDMDTDSGGWTVIQQRVDGSLPFWNESWQSYKQGFGTPGVDTNFWAGNELIHLLTNKDDKVVFRVDLWGDRDPGSPHADDYWWGEYYIKVGDETSSYTLTVEMKYLDPDKWTTMGNASSGWYDLTCADGIKFSTVDKINDPLPKCVTDYHLSGWWLNYCGTTSLNGEYVPPISYGNGYGFIWMVDGYYIINPVKSRMSLRSEQPGTKTKIKG